MTFMFKGVIQFVLSEIIIALTRLTCRSNIANISSHNRNNTANINTDQVWAISHLGTTHCKHRLRWGYLTNYIYVSARLGSRKSHCCHFKVNLSDRGGLKTIIFMRLVQYYFSICISIDHETKVVPSGCIYIRTLSYIGYFKHLAIKNDLTSIKRVVNIN